MKEEKYDLTVIQFGSRKIIPNYLQNMDSETGELFRGLQECKFHQNSLKKKKNKDINLVGQKVSDFDSGRSFFLVKTMKSKGGV